MSHGYPPSASRAAAAASAAPKRASGSVDSPLAMRTPIATDITLTAVPALPIVALFGPTGVGKTEVAIALAELLRADGEDPVAVSADALQLYAGLEILTGAATAAERARLEHRLLGVLPITARATAGDFARRAHAEIDALVAAGRRPIVVGGTGLYVRAAVAELDLRPPADPSARARYRERLATGAPMPRGDQLWTAETRRPTLLVALSMEREALYARIDARVTAMVAAGAADEVRRADAAGASPSARKALGFEELLRGDVDAMKRRTRNYAKRQLTWLRRLEGANLLDAASVPADTVFALAQPQEAP